MWFDAGVVEAASGAVPTWLAVALLALSFLGSVYVVAPGVAVAVLVRDRLETPVVATWPGIVIGGYGIFVTLKPLFAIDRPPVDPPFGPALLPGVLGSLYDLGVGVTSSSFPSGHALAATVFWGLVAIDLEVGSRRARLGLASGIVSVVAFSRVALGVHYPGDVLAGVAVGIGYLGLATTIRNRASRPATATLALGCLLACGGFVSGRWFDALVLLTAAGATGLCYRIGASRLAAPPRPWPFRSAGKQR